MDNKYEYYFEYVRYILIVRKKFKDKLFVFNVDGFFVINLRIIFWVFIYIGYWAF